jgi:MOSC domain-containing protein YiiM
MARGSVVAVCTSEEKHTQKKEAGEVLLTADYGIEGDAHAGFAHRQVSLLGEESIDTMRGKGVELPPGAFGENLVTRGLDLISLEVGQRLEIGDQVVLEVTQIGKECVDRCAIYYTVGDCVMPREGVFARVISGGRIKPGDEIRTAGS